MKIRLLAAALVAVVASAQDESMREEARALLREGNALFKSEEYTGALSKYRAAYAKVASPKILLNIGTTLRRMGRDAEAADAYETYLQHIGPDVPADKKARVRDALREIDQKMGRIRIEVTVEGATVRLDDKIKGVSPLGGSIRVDPGWHRAEAEKDGYQSHSQDIDVAAGEERLIVLRPQESPAPVPSEEPVDVNPEPAPPDPPPDPPPSEPLILEATEEGPRYSHAWQFAIAARQDFVLRTDQLGAFTGIGLNFGLGDYVDVSLWGIRGRSSGGRGTLTAYPLPHYRIKPMLVAGLTLLDVTAEDEAGDPYGIEPLIRAGGGAVGEITDRFSLVLEVAYERFFVSLDNDQIEDQRVMASLAVLARLWP